MDVLAVREATRFAIDYCSVQSKVFNQHCFFEKYFHFFLSGSPCLWNFHLPLPWSLYVWPWNQLPYQVSQWCVFSIICNLSQPALHCTPQLGIKTRFCFRDEVQEMRKTRDPITGFRDRLIAAELAETSEIKAIELEVKQSVDADVKKAKVYTDDLSLSFYSPLFYRPTVKSERRSSILTFMKTISVARYDALMHLH